MTDKGSLGRIAFRQQGKVWRAYWCPNEHNMKGKLELGSIRMSLVPPGSDRKQEFMDLMKKCFADIVEEQLGKRPDWTEPRRAPENERAGHA